MKRFVLFSALGLGLMALILGPGLLWAHLRALRNQAVHELEEQVPDAHVESQAREQIKDFDRQLRKAHVKLGELADKAASAEMTCKDTERQLATQKQRLGRIAELLDRPQPPYEIAGRSYTRQEIEEEGKALLSHCQHLEARLAAQRQLAGKLREALTEGRAQLVQARRARQEMAAELETVKTRLATARLRQNLDEMSAGLRASVPGPDTELARHLGKLRERARKAELETEAGRASTGGAIVDWGGPSSGTNPRQSIRRYLQEDSRPVAGR